MWLASRRPRSSCTQTRFKLAHVDTSNFARKKNHDLHEAVTTLEKAARISKRVLGGAHPLTAAIKEDLDESQDAVQLKKDLSG